MITRFKLATLSVATLTGVCMPIAVHADSYTDYGKVTRVSPQYDRVSVPRKHCTSETITETRRGGDERSYGGAVVGAIAGGLLGSQVGGGNGKTAAAAVGAAVGALAGDHIDNRDRRETVEEVPREVQRCRRVDAYEERVVGYQVTYDYRGQQYTTFMRNDPGREVRLRVSVELDQ
ncbi:glycine zipper 2TM domain-containing protein [Burkholderiaceae bacterium DAT-1]|nr:glycine zipper 2TM domain-containing protein [Burkholderiaceae bacterium DAT-1]